MPLTYSTEWKNQEVRDFSNNSLQPVPIKPRYTQLMCYQQPCQQSFTRHHADVITTYLSSGIHDSNIDSHSLRISPLYQDRWEGSRGLGKYGRGYQTSRSSLIHCYHTTELSEQYTDFPISEGTRHITAVK